MLTPADDTYHIDKHAFTTPFVCGARNLGEALRRIAEGAAMIRTKGEPGTGDVVHAVQHMRQIVREIKALTVLGDEELYNAAKVHGAPYELVRMVAQTGKLPVPNFSAGGIATPADAALMMQLGAETVFVGSGIFMKERATPLDVENNQKEREEAVSRARAIVIAATHFDDPKILAEASEAADRRHEGPGSHGDRRKRIDADARLVRKAERKVVEGGKRTQSLRAHPGPSRALRSALVCNPATASGNAMMSYAPDLHDRRNAHHRHTRAAGRV